MDRNNTRTDSLYAAIIRAGYYPYRHLFQDNLNIMHAFVAGFLEASDERVRDWNCLTGFNEFCAAYYNDYRSYGFATLIKEHCGDQSEVDLFYELLERHLDEREKKGFPMSPPPHFQIGGIYASQNASASRVWICLAYIGGAYLIALTDLSSDKFETKLQADNNKKMQVRLAWLFWSMLPEPSGCRVITTIPIIGDYSLLGGRRVIGEGDQRTVVYTVPMLPSFWEFQSGELLGDMTLRELGDGALLRSREMNQGGKTDTTDEFNDSVFGRITVR